MTPKDDIQPKKNWANSTIKAETNHYKQDSLSPQRESMFERSKIKPYSKPTQQSLKQRVDYSDPA